MSHRILIMLSDNAWNAIQIWLYFWLVANLFVNGHSPGACEGSVACSTCHVILEAPVFDELPAATDEENDMLDLAFGLTPTYDVHYCV